ncbi:MAG: DEAD/DEAH box helicase family protein [Armatimonadetes bacterium]|nr:DEAD/DEAH box helicase family protein [Armatimonadota bacterium]
MALHPKFPKSPYEILDPDIRWFPADEDLREKKYDQLLPPLVAVLRRKVKEWRDTDYAGASETSRALLKWWFQTEHIMPLADGANFEFKYYFAQREAVETIIFLHEIAQARDKYDLLRYDSSEAVSAGMFHENWRRYVIKMATGSGKTKVLSLILAWSFFHKLYEEDSTLARNFLVITPNIIVLDRIRSDFEGLKIFFHDPVLPDDGYADRNWRQDFQLNLHIQDDIGVVPKTGNIFLTNIHRVYDRGDVEPSFDDEDLTSYFLGPKPVGATSDSKVDLGDIVRDIEELMVLNDEAHHIHDERLAWFKSIQDIHNRLKMKGAELSMQVDVTATPRHNNGAIFVQTVSDYPLVEAIYQDVVKHPVLPDSASRSKIQERQTSNYVEKYQDYIHLGFLEWKKVYDELSKDGKKAVLFVMTDDTRNCDDVADYLERRYPELRNATLVIHTKNNGEIAEASSGRGKEELEKLRKAANEIDDPTKPYKAIVSVLMLKEGWDVRNVTTIVGLRAYSAKSNILPEQTLGRGLRCMYRGEGVEEYVSVVGTDAFMDFVESIQSEGVELEHKEMGGNSQPKAPLIVEIDRENTKKDIDKLDIQIPVLTPRVFREYKNLSDLDISVVTQSAFPVKKFSEEEKREIIFRYIVKSADSEETIHHKTQLDTELVPNYQSVIGYFTQVIMKELRLISGYDVLYGKVKEFIKYNLFDEEIDLEDLNVLRNLSEPELTRTIIEGFKKQINALTVLDKGDAEIRDYIKISKCRPFVAKDQGYIMPTKSAFNKIIGDSHFELIFAGFLENTCSDIVAYVKNYFAVNFKIDYQNADGDISYYYPDFVVKVSQDDICIVETKGREDLDDPLKIQRLAAWCDDINDTNTQAKYSYLYLKEDEFEKYQVNSFAELRKVFGN